MRRVAWSGAFVVTVTPFTETGKFDETSIRALIETLIEEGANGLVLAGSTGEWFTMSDNERIELFRIAADQNRGRVTLIAGTSTIATSSAVHLHVAAKELKFDGAMVLPPPYILPTNREFMEYFRALDDVGLPIMVYNNPGRTGVNVDAKRLDSMLQFKTVVALKDSVKDLSQISATIRAHGDELAIFTGMEPYLVPVMQRGGVGVVAMAPNVFGSEAIDLYTNIVSGQWESVAATQAKIDMLYEWMYGAGVNPYVVLKEGMRLLNRPGGHPRPPLLPMTADERSRFSSFLDSVQIKKAA